MAKKKYYVVWKGRQPGIYPTWDLCKKQILGYIGAQYQSFLTLEEAQKALKNGYQKKNKESQSKPELSEADKQKFGTPILNSISVDAACSGNPGWMEYQGVETETKKSIFKMGPLEESTNNIGEFLALVHALAWMKQNNDPRPIYSDSRIAIGWVQQKVCKTQIKKTTRNTYSFELIARALDWLKDNTYTNKILKWETKAWGEIPADFGRK